MHWESITLLLLLSWGSFSDAALIDRRAALARNNPTRTKSSTITPMQVGNGGFAYGADVTGLQTFQPFNTLSNWAWKSDPPPDDGENINDYHGLLYPTHGKDIPYDIPDPALPVASQWLISNPNRVNLGRIGLEFLQNITEKDIVNAYQKLDLYSGTLYSWFTLWSEIVNVTTRADITTDTVVFTISSNLLSTYDLGIFLDFPYSFGGIKFAAPFVGDYTVPQKHVSVLNVTSRSSFSIAHSQDNSTYYTSVLCSQPCSVKPDPSPDLAHRYHVRSLNPISPSVISFSVRFSSEKDQTPPTSEIVEAAAKSYWEKYWMQGGFVDFSGSKDGRWRELERRVVLSQYHMAVNEAGNLPPQESGLVNNGWYGKFHMEMYFWHSAHWALWNQWDILDKSSAKIYTDFLPSSIQRAKDQGYEGARWPKMTSPSGRASPGLINVMLIWEQPHPLFFAELEYRNRPTVDTLVKWEEIVRQTADFMASYAFWNATTHVYDLGPPMYVVSENTPLNITINPAFEVSYWHFGLGVAMAWMKRLGRTVPDAWIRVDANLAPRPVQNKTYVIFEGITDAWTSTTYTSNHPSMSGLYGWLPPTAGLDLGIVSSTLVAIEKNWHFESCWGWDFPMLAMQAARLGDSAKAVDWLLHPNFGFDDIGMPEGGSRVSTPYFPGSGGLLYAIGLMAAGWDGSTGYAPGFSPEWNIRWEGLSPAI